MGHSTVARLDHPYPVTWSPPARTRSLTFIMLHFDLRMLMFVFYWRSYVSLLFLLFLVSLKLSLFWQNEHTSTVNFTIALRQFVNKLANKSNRSTDPVSWSVAVGCDIWSRSCMWLSMDRRSTRWHALSTVLSQPVSTDELKQPHGVTSHCNNTSTQSHTRIILTTITVK